MGATQRRRRADVVISGGGTGGHIYPGLAVAEVLQEQRPDVEIAYIGTARGLEAQIVPRLGYRFYAVPAQGLARRFSPALLKTVWTAGRGVWAAWDLLRTLRPYVVLGTGGYVAGPVGLAAIVRRVPLILQEQNAFPGLTNRFLARFAWRIALGSAAARAYLPPSDRLVVTGNPIRKGIASVSRAEGRQRLSLMQSGKVVLAMGASQGARSINKAFLKHAARLRRRADLQVVLVTGHEQFESVCQALHDMWGAAVGEAERVKRWGDFWVRAFIDDMGAALASADLVVGRAGAISIAELTARGVPAILVPYPYAAEGHQEKNARELAEVGAAYVVADDETEEKLVDVMLQLIDDRARLESMRDASARLGSPDAASRVADLLQTWLP